MKLLFYSIFISTLLSGCVSWNPKLGMSSSQFDSMCAKSFNGSSVIVSSKNTIEIRRCKYLEGTLYTFENNVLLSIDRDNQPNSFKPSVVYIDSGDNYRTKSAIRELESNARINEEQRQFDKRALENEIRLKELREWKPGQRTMN